MMNPSTTGDIEMTEFEKAKTAWDNYVSWKNEWLKACASPIHPVGSSWTRHCNDMFLKAKARYDACLISHADIKVITEGWEEKMYDGVAKVEHKENAIPLMTHAQIAKATKDHLEANWEHYNVSSGLSEKQVWRIGYIYADVYMDYFGRPTRKQFAGSHFDCLLEAVERFDHEREMWLASRP